jgi:hypothetical protein
MPLARRCSPLKISNRKKGFAATLRLNNGQARHPIEVPEIGRMHAITEFKCGYTDQQIGKRNSQSPDLVFTIELAVRSAMDVVTG